MTRLLLVGWDAADWKVIDPLLTRGEMANLARIIAAGVRGNSATIYPPLSPMVWTSIATGKRPTKHGIHGFTEPTEDGLAVRAVSNLGRRTKAFWNILNQNGKRCIVVGWWPSHPAEPVNGAMVSNHFPLSTTDQPDAPLAAAIVSPPTLAAQLAELRVHPTEITGEILRLFIPEARKIDQEKDKSLHDLAGIIAETMSIHAAATELMATTEWDLAAVYFAGIDHFSHRFMRYHARKRRTAGEASDPALFRGIVASAYRYHDLMLGRLMQLAGPDCAVLVLSDHGFHSDAMLPDHIPAEAAGPAVEHRDFGIFCLQAPGVLQNECIYGASVLDIAPTVLHLFGLPAGADMDGKVLINAFADRTLPARIPSWDEIAGEDGRHPPERQFDGAASVESLKQLVDLRYVAPPGGDAAAAVRDCMTENRYNLARAHMDAGELDKATEHLESLIAEDAGQIRYHQHLFQCLLAQGRHEDCARMLDTLDASAPDIAREAAAALKARRADTPDRELAAKQPPELRREMFERRQFAEKLGGFAAERMLMRCALLLAQGRPEDKEAARPLLDQLAARRRLRRPLAMFLAESYARLGEPERALDFIRRIRRIDRDNWRALALEAQIHHAAGRHDQAADRAIQSLALMYPQPMLHHLLGLSLVRLGEMTRAEQEFRVALAQAPGLIAAHEALAALLRRDSAKLGEASVHMARAESIAAETTETGRAPGRVRARAGRDIRAERGVPADRPVAPDRRGDGAAALGHFDDDANVGSRRPRGLHRCRKSTGCGQSARLFRASQRDPPASGRVLAAAGARPCREDRRAAAALSAGRRAVPVDLHAPCAWRCRGVAARHAGAARPAGRQARRSSADACLYQPTRAGADLAGTAPGDRCAGGELRGYNLRPVRDCDATRRFPRRAVRCSRGGRRSGSQLTEAGPAQRRLRLTHPALAPTIARCRIGRERRRWPPS